MSRVGSLLRGMRLARQLDVPSMAGALGTDPRRLELVEAGYLFPTAAERRGWAERLGFSDLLDFDQQWRAGWIRLSAAHPDGWIPIINKAPAGDPTDYEEYGIDSGSGYDYLPRSQSLESPHAEILFAVIVIGDSMSPAWREGDLAIFRPVDPHDLLPDGSQVLVRFTAERNHTCTFKTIFRRSDHHLELRPLNRLHRTLIVPSHQIDRMALAIERRPRFWIPPGPRRVRDQYAQEFPDE